MVVSKGGGEKVHADLTDDIHRELQFVSFDSALAQLTEAHSRELIALQERIRSQELELELYRTRSSLHSSALTGVDGSMDACPGTPGVDGSMESDLKSSVNGKTSSSSAISRKDMGNSSEVDVDALRENSSSLLQIPRNDSTDQLAPNASGMALSTEDETICDNTVQLFLRASKVSSKGSNMRAASRARSLQDVTVEYISRSEDSDSSEGFCSTEVENWRRFVERSLTTVNQKWVAPRQEWKRTSAYVKTNIKELGSSYSIAICASASASHFVKSMRSGRVGRSYSQGGKSRVMPSLNFHMSRIPEVRCSSLIVEPYSPRRMWWILLGVLLILYDAIAMPLQAFGEAEHPIVDVIDWTLQIYWTLDIAICFMTGVYVNSDLEMRPKEVAKLYARSWLGIDLLVTLPAWVVLFIRGAEGGDGTRSLKLAKFMRVLRFIRLLRIFKIEKLLNETLDSINSSALLLAIGVAKLIFALAFICHISACFFFFLGSSETDGRKGWAHNDIMSGASTLYEYLSAAHWAITQFQGTSDIVPGSTVAERAYAVSAVLISLVLLASFVSSLTNMMMNFQSNFRQLTYRNDVVRGYLRSNSVPSHLAIQIKKYIAWKHRLDYVQEFDVAMPEMLPPSLWMDVLFNVRTPALCTYSYFQSVTVHFPRLVRKLAFEAMDLIWPHPAEVLFSCNDEGARMYFVTEGKIQYTFVLQSLARSSLSRKSTARSMISKGMYLSEGSLWTTWTHLGECKALETLGASSKVLALRASKFIDITLPCRPAHAYGVQYAKQFCAMFNQYGRTYSDYIDPIEFENAKEEDADMDVDMMASDVSETLQLQRTDT